MNKVKIFEGQEVKVKTDKGVTLINLVSTAKSCGLTRDSRGYQIIRWDDIKIKLKSISKICFNESSLKDIQVEITYILDEIENSDDRNSIYMSSWLSKRLALECHSDKAMRYKNFLINLDEARESNQLAIQPNEVTSMVGQVINQIIPTLTEQLAQQVVPVMVEAKNQVNNMVSLMHDQSAIYDHDREDLKSLIGLRAVNTKRLTDALKEKLSGIYGINISGNSQYYLRAKAKVFKEFRVIKWEDIPATKYNNVYAFIDGLDC